MVFAEKVVVVLRAGVKDACGSKVGVRVWGGKPGWGAFLAVGG